MLAKYSTRTDAIHAEIITPIEVGMAEVWEYDIEAIADEVLGGYDEGFACQIGHDEFWSVVEKHKRVLRIEWDEPESRPADWQDPETGTYHIEDWFHPETVAYGRLLGQDDEILGGAEIVASNDLTSEEVQRFFADEDPYKEAEKRIIDEYIAKI